MPNRRRCRRTTTGPARRRQSRGASAGPDRPRAPWREHAWANRAARRAPGAANGRARTLATVSRTSAGGLASQDVGDPGIRKSRAGERPWRRAVRAVPLGVFEPAAQVALEIEGRHRPGVQEALSEAATERPEPVRLILGLDAFRDHVQAERPPEL